jgi:hypothetical protein
MYKGIEKGQGQTGNLKSQAENIGLQIPENAD